MVKLNSALTESVFVSPVMGNDQVWAADRLLPYYSQTYAMFHVWRDLEN